MNQPAMHPRQRILEMLESAGTIPFAAFMEEALYGEGGYYARQRPAIGQDGDFVTGSSLSPFFGRCTATLIERLDEAMGAPADFFEAGCGGGEHLSATAGALGDGPARTILGWDRVDRDLTAGVRQLTDLQELAPGSVGGLVFSYELFDALPVHRLIRRGRHLHELMVEREGEGLDWGEETLSDPRLSDWNAPGLEEGQILDVTPEWAELYTRLARRLHRGLIVTCDYGFVRERLFDARVRLHGTLACYRRQRVHRNPFVDIGEQDLTAHVDFTSLIEAGESEGLETFGLFRQAEWLAATGLLDGMESRSPEQRIEVMQLMDLEGMGEEIRVLVQARGLDAAKVLPLLA